MYIISSEIIFLYGKYTWETTYIRFHYLTLACCHSTPLLTAHSLTAWLPNPRLDSLKQCLVTSGSLTTSRSFYSVDDVTQSSPYKPLISIQCGSLTVLLKYSLLLESVTLLFSPFPLIWLLILQVLPQRSLHGHDSITTYLKMP